MSAPAANAFWLPVRTTAPMPSSASSARRASVSSSISWRLSAFKASGRLSVIRPTAPWVSNNSVSYDISESLSLLAAGRHAFRSRHPYPQAPLPIAIVLDLKEP